MLDKKEEFVGPTNKNGARCYGGRSTLCLAFLDKRHRVFSWKAGETLEEAEDQYR
jgi:hypothetical protein